MEFKNNIKLLVNYNSDKYKNNSKIKFPKIMTMENRIFYNKNKHTRVEDKVINYEISEKVVNNLNFNTGIIRSAYEDIFAEINIAYFQQINIKKR